MRSTLSLFVAAAALQAEALVVGSARPVVSARSAISMDAPPPPAGKGRLGGTIDQDGKSNVWAVEPKMEVEGAGTKKGLMAYAPVIGVAGLAVLAVPLLPLLFAANPDQA